MFFRFSCLRFILLPTIFFSASVNSFAQDYYWRSTSSYSVKFNSPQLACEGYIEYLNSVFLMYDHRFTSLVGNSATERSCNMLMVVKGSGQSFKTTHTVARYGAGCTLPSVFDPATSSCKIPDTEMCTNTTRQDRSGGQQAYEVNACVALEQKGPAESCPSSSAGNPINFAIGNKFQREVDYLATNSSAIKFSRSYNSLDGLWRHSFSTRLRIAPDAQSVALVMAHGRESFFTVSGNSVIASSADIGVLTKTATDWQFLSAENERFTFNLAGKLTSWIDASGGRQDLVYSGSQVSVTDHLGNGLSFTQDDKYQPLTLTAPGVQITYGYNANKRLTAVNKTQGGQTTQRQFHYEDTRNNALLTGITDERGVRYATWSYDDQGRAITSEHANGAERIAVEYRSDGNASVTNELGKVANYQFQTILGVKRITAIEGEPSANCSNSNSTFTYDSRGLLKTKTDNKGHQTIYDYNTRGLEISRTEAAGTPQARTTTTTWHTTLNLPLTVTEPGRITTHTYDAQGRKLNQTSTAI